MNHAELLKAMKEQGNLIIGVVGRPAEGNPSNAELEAAVDAAFINLLKRKSISELANIIRRDWKNVKFSAKPYLDSMRGLHDITDSDWHDSGRQVVAYFLANAAGWRGPIAKAVKAELKRRCK
jgi:hypothetical protein